MAYLAWRVMVGLNTEIILMMQMAGHARCLIDSGFAHIKQTYRRTDVDSVGQFAQVVERSAYSNRAVLYCKEDGTKSWEWRDWKHFFTAHFKALRGITTYQHFRFSSDFPGTVFLKKGVNAEETSLNLLKQRQYQFQNDDRPPVIQPAGLTRERQLYLFKRVRPYVRPMYQDETCPALDEE